MCLRAEHLSGTEREEMPKTRNTTLIYMRFTCDFHINKE